MDTGYSGTFVISWTQTEIGGLKAAPLRDLTVGAEWRWWGEAIRVDGPAGLITLDGAAGMADLRRRAAKSVRRILGLAGAETPGRDAGEDSEGAIQGFMLTDGRRSYEATLVETDDAVARLIVFAGALPPRGSDLYVIDATAADRAPEAPQDRRGGVICFTPGTMIRTPDGACAIEAIRPGDRILTRDDGPQEVLWTGARRMTGARLYAMPHLRPVRVRAGAMGEDRPEADLLVSPRHRMLVRGAAARALFNEAEVLVAAADLIDDHMVHVETSLREVTYVHLMTERHEVVWANGLETESFHPGLADFDMLDPAQRAGLQALVPSLRDDPFSYGAFARRNLSTAEAAILRHDAA